jgi:hypothetical protein
MKKVIQVALSISAAGVLSCLGAEPDVPLSLTVKLDSRYNQNFAVCTDVHIGQPFRVEWTHGNVESSISGTVEVPEGELYPLRLTVSQHVTTSNHTGNSSMQGYRLKLNAPEHSEDVVSSAFNDIEERDVLLKQGECPGGDDEK